jgi:cytochrome P450
MLSMSCYVYHQHEPYFPRASEFWPDRWLDEKSAAEAEKNFIAFSRGSRNCIGMNLAYAELFIGFAYLFRRFEMERAEGMTDRDMEWHDAFVVATFGHLRVKLREVQG